jgi:hypothetical protein
MGIAAVRVRLPDLQANISNRLAPEVHYPAGEFDEASRSATLAASDAREVRVTIDRFFEGIERPQDVFGGGIQIGPAGVKTTEGDGSTPGERKGSEYGVPT